jgi:hypothetical protein
MLTSSFRVIVAALLPWSTGCATSPDVTSLCGTWAGDDTRELWWIDGKGLRGEGRRLDDRGVEQPFERLALQRARGGHAYIAQPGDAPPTTFAPIDPRAAKFGPPNSDDEGEQAFAWANYEHDFPQEIHYRVAGDRLQAMISGPAQAHGWAFERITACAGSERPQ